jgi:hypothetical protein
MTYRVIFRRRWQNIEVGSVCNLNMQLAIELVAAGYCSYYIC